MSSKTSSELPPYAYRPLKGPKWIRIIQLHHSCDFESNLECTIIDLDRTQLAQSTSPNLNYYSAVSYVWGTPVFSQDLTCLEPDGSRSIIKITPNVQTMLRRFRKQTKSRNLWIDAICLDQKNKSEIGGQVQLMGEIYTQARKVLVWLGDENHDRVFAFLRTMANVDEDVVPTDDGFNTVTKALSGLFSPDPPIAIQQFFHLPWFGRRWILQELALSRDATIHCHVDQISKQWFKLALEKLIAWREAHKESFPFDEGAQDALTTAVSLQTRPENSLKSVWTYHKSNCFDPKDRIFSLAALPTEQNYKREDGATDLGFDVDYNLSTGAVFSRFAAFWVSKGHFDTIVHHALAFGTLSDVDDTVPSWCPDWTKSRRKNEPNPLRDAANMEWSSTKWFRGSWYEKKFRTEPWTPESPSEEDVTPDEGTTLAMPSHDSQAIFTRQAVAEVYRCAGPWPDSSTWNWKDVLAASLHLFPTNRLKPGALLADILCKGVFVLTDFGREYSQAFSLKYLENTLSVVLSSLLDPEEQVQPDPSPLEILKGPFLRATLDLMRRHCIIVAPFGVKRIGGMGRSGGTEGNFCLGLAPSGVTPGDILLLHSRFFRESPAWRLQIDYAITPILKSMRTDSEQEKEEQQQHQGALYSPSEDQRAKMKEKLGWNWGGDRVHVCQFYGLAFGFSTCGKWEFLPSYYSPSTSPDWKGLNVEKGWHVDVGRCKAGLSPFAEVQQDIVFV